MPQTDPPGRIIPMTLALACWMGFALVAWAMSSGHLASFDRMGLLLWRADDLTPLGPHWLTDLALRLTDLGGWKIRDAMALAAVATLALRHHRRAALVFAGTGVAGACIEPLLKNLFARARPDLAPHLTGASGYAFPSGHSFNSAAIAMGIALALASTASSQQRRVAMIACAVAISLSIAWSRVFLGVHWPSDVIAGWLGGTGLALLVATLHRPRG